VTTIPEAAWGAPDTEFDRIVIRPKLVWHAGVFGAAVSAVATRALEIVGAAWTVNQWTGYDCAILSKYDFAYLAPLHFRVLSNTADTLTIRTDSPDPDALGVDPGDVLVMFSKPTVSGLVVTDALWQNTLSNAGAGLAVNEEADRVLRIIAGTGRGYRYPIASNNATSITIAGAWVVTPDSTSRYIIEDPAPLPETQSSSLGNSDPTAFIYIDVLVANYAGKTLLFEAVTLDGGGNESTAFLNPIRMAYIPGAQGTRTIFTSDTQRITDGLLLCDTGGISGSTTTLAAALTDTTGTAVSVASGTGIVDGTYIQCGTEAMRVVSGGGTASLVVERGSLGTTAATHLNAATVDIPGVLTVTLLPASSIPNHRLTIRKTSADLNYVRITADGDDEFPGGGATKDLPSNSETEGTRLIVFPG